MGAPKYAKRKDKNHADIVDDLKPLGMIVLDCAAKGFYTDLLIGWRGVWCFFEVKNPDRMTKKQSENRAKSLTDVEESLREKCFRNDLPFKIVISADEIIDYMTELTVQP